MFFANLQCKKNFFLVYQNKAPGQFDSICIVHLLLVLRVGKNGISKYQTFELPIIYIYIILYYLYYPTDLFLDLNCFQIISLINNATFLHKS